MFHSLALCRGRIVLRHSLAVLQRGPSTVEAALARLIGSGQRHQCRALGPARGLLCFAALARLLLAAVAVLARPLLRAATWRPRRWRTEKRNQFERKLTAAAAAEGN